jgi:hypothetical protein
VKAKKEKEKTNEYPEVKRGNNQKLNMRVWLREQT